MLRFIDFCAGIGGGRLGIERGINAVCVGYSEIARSSIITYNALHANSKNETNFGDLTKINISELPDFDVMLAGFPCQAFSIMGLRQGFSDDRGQIIYYLIKILKKKRVPYFILENVKGLLSHDDGNTIKIIIKSLEEAGYYTEYKILNSLDYGTPQMRERVYFIGILREKNNLNKFEWPKKTKIPALKNYLCNENAVVLDINNKTFQNYLNNKYNKNRINIYELLKKDYLVIDTRQSDLRTYENKTPTLRTGRHGVLYVKNQKLYKLSGFESLLLQGFGEEYAKKTIGKISEMRLLSQAGNAMTATVIEQISKKLFGSL